MPATADLGAVREALVELAPAARRAVSLEPRSLVRLRFAPGAVTALIRLPFDVLVARTVPAEDPVPGDPVDTTVRAEDLLSWLDGKRAAPPVPVDALWRWAVPPTAGWQRVETVPDTVIRPLVRTGALTLKELAEREGVPGAQPRQQTADALLDAVVLTATSDDGTARAEVTLRALSALVRMGFVKRGSSAHLDVAGRWTRLAAVYGSVFAERGGLDVTAGTR